MKKVAFYTLGCKLNFSETSTIGRLFETKGYKKVEFYENADIYVINTCSVTDHADKKCRKVVNEALKYSPGAYIVIIGCYAQLKPNEIASIPGVDAVLGAAEKFRLLDILGDFEKKKSPAIYNQVISEAKDYYCSYSINDRTRTFLKVQDGCDYSCSFCTIPLARGSSRSDQLDNIILTARKIGETEVKEIVLTGVNLGDVGIINGTRQFHFIDLIRQLDEVEGIDRFRISSIEPNLLSDEIIEFVASSKKFVPHFHLPLQSGSNKILKLMRRRYQREMYLEKVNKIKALLPHCCIGVDVITGFPGEDEGEFTNTYNFLEALDVSYFHVFTYSERENTAASLMNGKVSGEIRHRRTKMLRELSESKKRQFYINHLNEDRKVLFEAESEQGMMYGFTDNYIRVTAAYDPLLVNEYKKVRLLKVNKNQVVEIGEPLAIELQLM